MSLKLALEKPAESVISVTLDKPSGKLYACFIDFKKAYDSV